jgi:hypothetical protein
MLRAMLRADFAHPWLGQARTGPYTRGLIE